MLQAMEIGTRPAISSIFRPQHISQDREIPFPVSRVSKVSLGAIDRPLPAIPAANLTAPFFKQFLARDRPIVSDGPPNGLPQGPKSEAESVFAARSGNPDSKDETMVFAKGVDYSGLDASWKVIPTAEIAASEDSDKVELLI